MLSSRRLQILPILCTTKDPGPKSSMRKTYTPGMSVSQFTFTIPILISADAVTQQMGDGI